ncbi:hypothetical protein F4778DRAFT_244700 [Xylariomycetidae sp. FL2044]|nr:hypothetical protein F4778DRAFT_244700 [Xylariomycetidae sp. FL2044]
MRRPCGDVETHIVHCTPGHLGVTVFNVLDGRPFLSLRTLVLLAPIAAVKRAVKVKELIKLIAYYCPLKNPRLYFCPHEDPTLGGEEKIVPSDVNKPRDDCYSWTLRTAAFLLKEPRLEEFIMKDRGMTDVVRNHYVYFMEFLHDAAVTAQNRYKHMVQEKAAEQEKPGAGEEKSQGATVGFASLRINPEPSDEAVNFVAEWMHEGVAGWQFAKRPA